MVKVWSPVKAFDGGGTKLFFEGSGRAEISSVIRVGRGLWCGRDQGGKRGQGATAVCVCAGRAGVDQKKTPEI